MNSDEFNEIISRLDDLSNRLKNLENVFTKDLNGRSDRILPSNAVNESNLELMSHKTGISIKYLNEIYEIENEDVNINLALPNKMESEKQEIASLLILACGYYCFGSATIAASSLNKKLKWLGIKSTSNLKKNLAVHGYFETVGKAGSNNFQYKITFPGVQKAVELIKQLKNG